VFGWKEKDDIDYHLKKPPETNAAELLNDHRGVERALIPIPNSEVKSAIAE